MRQSFSIVVTLCVALGLTSSIALAKLSEELGTEPNQLETLTNEASRAALFSRVRGMREEEIMAGPDDRTKQLVGKSGRFVFPFDAQFDGSATKPRKNSIFGIDISHHVDPKVPFQKLSASKVSFVYAKATQGTKFKDGKFESFWKTLGDLPQDKKIHRGAYHFLTAGHDPEAQAATFLKFIATRGGLQQTDMPPVLDLEWEIYNQGAEDKWKSHTPDQIVQKALAWLKLVKEETGRTPLLYTSYVWWRERGLSDSALDQLLKEDYGIWIADYSLRGRAQEVPKFPSGKRWALWQFTDKAKLPNPYAQGVDATIYKGTKEQFYEMFGLKKFQDDSP